jgi:group II intron reverse transcriptase/maturase
MHHITVDLLDESYHELKRGAAPGVDQVTWNSFGTQLEARLQDLHQRVQSGRYEAKPSRRIYLPKPDGRKRPIGIAALEDKIVQRATVRVLNQIYEVDFAPFSYGFRPGKSQHDALDALWVGMMSRKINWIVDADIRSFFDTIDHGQMMRILRVRIADERLLRLIAKWLRAGISEDGKWSPGTVGTPQGAVISPLLANIYLHYVLDLWVQDWRARHAHGDIIIVRFADDFVIGFQYEREAKRWLQNAKMRLAHFNLELHEDKTRLIEFGRFAAENRGTRGQGKPETFDFLGFTHICAKTRKNGKFTILRHTMRKRLKAALDKVKEELRKRMHATVKAQGRWLRQAMRGYFNYHAVPGNSQVLETFRAESIRAWFKALRRRSQRARKRTNWEKMKGYVRTYLPSVKITHPYPNMRLFVN